MRWFLLRLKEQFDKRQHVGFAIDFTYIVCLVKCTSILSRPNNKLKAGSWHLLINRLHKIYRMKNR